MTSLRHAIMAIILGAVLLMLPSFYPAKPADPNITVVFKSEASHD